MTRRRVALAVLLAALGVAALVLPLGRWAVVVAEALRGLGGAGMAGFVGLYAAATVLMVPGSALTLLAGFVYGLGAGVALVVPASLLGATAAMALGRRLLRGLVERRAAGDPRWRAVDRAVGRQGFRTVLLLRLSPVFPFTFLNYALGATSVPLRTYVAASAVGMLPGTFAYVYLGTLITDVARLAGGAEAAGASGSTARTVLTALGVAATLALVAWIARLARQALREAADLPPTTPDP